jgi:putative hemolysin
MEILIIFLLILLNGIFSMSEIALISARKNRLETAAKKGNNNAKAALDLANAPNKFLSAVQIGITLIGILTGIYSGEKITTDMQHFVASFSFLSPYSQPIAVGIVVVTLTFFSLVFGELLPKRIGLNYPERIAKAVAKPMQWVALLTAPFIWLLTTTTDFILKILQIRPTADGSVTEEEIKAIIKEGTEGGEVQAIEQDIVERVFYIGDRKINSLMTHRKDVAMIPANSLKEQVQAIVLSELHSFYPVCNNNLDDIVGIVSLKSIVSQLNNHQFEFEKIIVPASFMSEHTTAYHALETFKKSRLHYALVTDEFGVVQGIITLNDILEALVGNASDFDELEPQMTALADNVWQLEGSYSLHDFLSYFDLQDLANDYQVNTVGGLIISELGYIPVTDEILIWNKIKFLVQSVQGAKIGTIEVRLI